MTIIEAILNVMRDAGRPLTPTEAYSLILDKNLYTFNAQNPQGVVTGQIRRHCKGLEFPSADNKKYFQLESDGRFSPLPKPIRIGPPGRGRTRSTGNRQSAVSAVPMSLSSAFAEIRELQEIYRKILKEKILEELKSLAPTTFEHFSKKLLDVYGFKDLHVTSVSNDGGVDGYGKLKVGLADMRVAFQCKRWTKTNIGRPEIDRFRGAIQGEFEQGVFFTTAHFVPAAKQASIRPGAVPIILVDGALLVDLMIEKQFGVQEERLAIHTYALDTVLADEDET